jgi:DNA (cytosine-5)-methyltransferase 1
VVRPRYVFLENVPGLLASGYFGTILGDLAESGYDCRWRILSATELGAPHLRKRVWIVAYSTELQFRQESRAGVDGVGRAGAGVVSREGTVLADAERDGPQGAVSAESREGTPGVRRRSTHESNEVADANRDGYIGKMREAGCGADEPQLGADVVGEGSGDGGSGPSCSEMADATGEGRDATRCAGEAVSESGSEQRSSGCGCGQPDGWWDVEPDVGRVADGVASRVDRLRALGNGQVPAVVAAAWRLLTADDGEYFSTEDL